MKNTELLFIFYSLLNSINSQPTISYKESINMSLSKEYINIHNPHHPPSPSYITTPDPSLQIINIYYSFSSYKLKLFNFHFPKYILNFI